MKKEAEELIKSYIETIREGIEEKNVYKHLILSVLQIYQEQLSYTQVLNKIVEEVEGIRTNKKVFNSLCSLAESISNHNHDMRIIYAEEIAKDEEDWEDYISGAVFSYINVEASAS